ncbi:MAG: hypothetical protein ACYTGB_09525, partial [Planctomycetota bacterium]
MSGPDGSPALPFEEDLSAELRGLAEAGLQRAAREEPAGCVSFASNDYLRLRRDPRVVDAAASA